MSKKRKIHRCSTCAKPGFGFPSPILQWKDKEFGIGVLPIAAVLKQVWPSISPPDRCCRQCLASVGVREHRALFDRRTCGRPRLGRVAWEGQFALPGRDSLHRSMARMARNSAMGHIGRVVRQKLLPTVEGGFADKHPTVRSTLARSKQQDWTTTRP